MRIRLIGGSRHGEMMQVDGEPRTLSFPVAVGPYGLTGNPFSPYTVMAHMEIDYYKFSGRRDPDDQAILIYDHEGLVRDL